MSSDNKPSDFRARWDELRREYDALRNDKSVQGLGFNDPGFFEHEALISAVLGRIDDVVAATWATRASDPADLLLLAEIAYDVQWDLKQFPALPPNLVDEDYEDEAAAYLIRGVADAAEAQRSMSGSPGTPLSIREAAAQIVRLINANPRSPRLEEIEAVIAKVAAPPNAD